MYMSNMKNISITKEEEEEETWELSRAFGGDTMSYRGGMPNWPPRPYICTFCGREFRSAQALGGHMNVHRRDRARLHYQSNFQAQAQAQALIYHQLSSPNYCTSPTDDDNDDNNNIEVVLPSSSSYNEMLHDEVDNGLILEKEVAIEEELDLELRLGNVTTTTTTHDKFQKNNNTTTVTVFNF